MKPVSSVHTLAILASLAAAENTIYLIVNSSDTSISGDTVTFNITDRYRSFGNALVQPVTTNTFVYEPEAMKVYNRKKEYGPGFMEDGKEFLRYLYEPLVEYGGVLGSFATDPWRLDTPRGFESAPVKVKGGFLAINGSIDVFYSCAHGEYDSDAWNGEEDSISIFLEGEDIPHECEPVKIIAQKYPDPEGLLGFNSSEPSTLSNSTTSGSSISRGSSETGINSQAPTQRAVTTRSTNSQASNSQSASATKSKTKNGGVATATLGVAGFMAMGAIVLL